MGKQENNVAKTLIGVFRTENSFHNFYPLYEKDTEYEAWIGMENAIQKYPNRGCVLVMVANKPFSIPDSLKYTDGVPQIVEIAIDAIIDNPEYDPNKEYSAKYCVKCPDTVSKKVITATQIDAPNGSERHLVMIDIKDVKRQDEGRIVPNQEWKSRLETHLKNSANGRIQLAIVDRDTKIVAIGLYAPQGKAGKAPYILIQNLNYYSFNEYGIISFSDDSVCPDIAENIDEDYRCEFYLKPSDDDIKAKIEYDKETMSYSIVRQNGTGGGKDPEDDGLAQIKAELAAEKTAREEAERKFNQSEKANEELTEKNNALQEQLKEICDGKSPEEYKKECDAAREELKDTLGILKGVKEAVEKAADEEQLTRETVEQLIRDFKIELSTLDLARVTVDGHIANVLMKASAEWEKENDTDGLIQDTINELISQDANEPKPEDIIEYFVRNIQAIRSYSQNDIMNIAICMTQGFLTVLSGSPGSGKTSICRNMAELLGLNLKLEDGGECNRFVDIAVGRGWTSQRDFIGYYNPLSKQFECGNQGMYEALQMLNKEGELGIAEERKYPLYVLLDEANLSPIEHYWSDFFGICDIDGDNRFVDCGGTYRFRIPQTMHFLATINNDETTTALSPRLIDRAWVITLPEPTLEQMLEANTDTIKNEDGYRITWKTLNAAFGPQNVGDNIRENLKGVLSALLGQNETLLKNYLGEDKKNSQMLKDWVSVSSRTFNAMLRYCTAAMLCFDGTDDEKERAAIDYAIAQKLLPQINVMDYSRDDGSSSVTGRLEDVEKFFEECGYVKSAAIMEKIIFRGKELGYYRFF